ncbi:MAG: hypothetical protein IH591_17575 [Bacteroidales bacterium]|nr:hypothetical protein [Bacteroidales bacterium]
MRDKDKMLIPLNEEVKIVEKYLAMEKTRFPDRLIYTINVTSEALNVEIIPFILQPFVENAIKYGMRTSPEILDIAVNGCCRGNSLIVEISNTGNWIEDSTGGTGIKNVRSRLSNAFPDRHKFQIVKSRGRVHIIIEITISR